MKGRGGIWTVGWLLLGLLALSTTLLVLGNRERLTQPSAHSYGPSGTRALAELLRQEGYRVTVSRSAKPKLKEEDLALGFVVEEVRPSYGPPVHVEEPVHKFLKKHLERGGRALLLSLPDAFRDATKVAQGGARQAAFTLKASSEAKWKITRGFSRSLSYESPPLEVDTGSGFTLVSDGNNDDLVKLFNHGDGILGMLFDATGATNRFIDADQNAEFLLQLVGTLSPERGQIIILEALNSAAVDDGLLATIGNWALAAWWQMILVFIVVAYGLGKRFGLPESIRYHQRGGRELVDAYADVMSRARMPQAALKKVVHEADREVRKAFSVSADLPPSRRNELLPEGLAHALSRAEIASESTITDSAAVSLLMRLEDEMAKLKGEPVRRRRRKR